MLNLYSARDNVDKERFIYDQIMASDTETFVLVPNQYTLVAEEQALRYMNTTCLFDTEILSMNRLGHRILAERGEESVQMLSKYGRFMLLTKIINEHKDNLTLFSKAAGKLSFTVMLDDFIASFKQQNCTMEDLEALLEDDESNTILKQKLGELKGIIADYEHAIEGRYTDSEDYIAMYVSAIPESRLVEGKTIWIYGYDSITPKFTQAMLELSRKASQVNLVINESDYGLDRKVVAAIKACAAEADVDCSEHRISSEYAYSKSETVSRIESGLFAQSAASARANADFIPADLELVQCANQYYEAENAAAYIHHLIRDEEFELRDIAVICNSEDVLQPIVKRALAEYGLPVFLDANRSITDSAGVVFIVNLLKCIAFDYSTDSIFAMLKTGLTDVKKADIEDLENYARDYHIRNTMWTREFRYGEFDLGEAELRKLNSLRESIIEPVVKLREAADSAATAGAFADSLVKILEEEFKLPARNENAAVQQESKEFFEDAQRTRISLEEAYKLLAQLKEILMDYPLDRKEFLDLYVTGLTSIEIGVIPSSLDGLSMGTLIRTRPRPSRAVIIVGANEGILPLQPAPEGLFSVDEKAYFRDKNFPLGSLDDIKMLEENAALYRMMSHSSEKLYVSYSMTDSEGADMVPSSVVDALRTFFPKLDTCKDVVSSGWGMNLVNDREETMRHMVNHIKDRSTPKEGDMLTRALLGWYRANTPDMLGVMLDAAQDENLQPKLDVELTRGLYARSNGHYVLSASKVEKYNNCPFSYYVAYGLSPKEERSFNSDPRSIGDLYHECLMMVAQQMMERKAAGEEPFTDEELRTLIDDKLSELAEGYKGGLFLSTGAERFHVERIREICFGAAKAVAAQLSSGAVEEMLFEEGFGNELRFAPVEIQVDGEKVYVEGRIDRADILKGDRIRIIDYKTGSDKVDVTKMSKGYKMQLMIYLMSATQDEYQPAGIFYFNIKEPEESLNDTTKKKEEEIRTRNPGDSFKLQGRYVDEPGVLDMMPREVIGGTKNIKLSRDEYEELKTAVGDKLKEIGNSMVSGEIQASPLIPDAQRIACTYCEYKAICRYDNENTGNRSRRI